MFFVELSDSLLVKYPTVPKSMVGAAATAILVPNCCLKPMKWLEYHDILPFLPHVHRSLFSSILYILWNILDYVFSGHPLYSKRISRITCLGQGTDGDHAHFDLSASRNKMRSTPKLKSSILWVECTEAFKRNAKISVKLIYIKREERSRK